MRSPAGRFHSGSGCMLMRMRVPVRSLPGNKVSRLRIDSSCACPASARRHPSVSCGRRVRDNKQQPFPRGHVYCLGSLNISANPSRSTSLSVWPSFFSSSSLLSNTASPLNAEGFFAFVFTRAASFRERKRKRSAFDTLPSPLCHRRIVIAHHQECNPPSADWQRCHGSRRAAAAAAGEAKALRAEVERYSSAILFV